MSTTAAQESSQPSAAGFPYRTSVHESGLPLIVHAGENRSVADLRRALEEHADFLAGKMTEHGAILFRGFDVQGAEDFEAVARGIDDELKNEYLGTSPRDGLTDYVFSASELPPFYPIPQHCEMSFTANPPRRVFFSCFIEPAEGGGETPLVDFRRVYAQLRDDVRKRFEDGGIRIVRNYSAPGASNRNPLQLKGWDEMFLTTDRAEVDRACAKEGFDTEWSDDGSLRILSTQPASRTHPVTGEPVWYNHLQSFHVGTGAAEYKRIFRMRPSLRHFAVWQVTRALVAIQKLTKQSDEQAMHCTYENGAEIPDADIEHVRDVTWENLVVVPWKRGDVVAIDNNSVAHGRLPYSGPREIAVCWA